MSLPAPYYEDDHATLYLGDCRDILPYLEPVDLVLTDPPYGLAYDTKKANKPNQTQFSTIANDTGHECVEVLFDFYKARAETTQMVVFGANCFPHVIPYGGRWVCWDKRCSEKADRMLGSPFELAWTSRKRGYDRMHRILHGGVVNANGRRPRYHPTEKPIALMRRIIEQDFSKAQLILDPFAGSGTTLIAARQLGKKAIGIEVEERYCTIIAERLQREIEEP